MAVGLQSLEPGQEIPVVSRMVTVEAAQDYSGWPEVKGIHTDESLARLLGYPSLVMQGQLGAAYISEMCLSFFGEHWARGGRLELKFIQPLYLPEATIRGVNREKVLEGDSVRVGLDVWIENGRGHRFQETLASVLLPSDGLASARMCVEQRRHIWLSLETLSKSW